MKEGGERASESGYWLSKVSLSVRRFFVCSLSVTSRFVHLVCILVVSCLSVSFDDRRHK